MHMICILMFFHQNVKSAFPEILIKRVIFCLENQSRTKAKKSGLATLKREHVKANNKKKTPQHFLYMQITSQSMQQKYGVFLLNPLSCYVSECSVN